MKKIYFDIAQEFYSLGFEKGFEQCQNEMELTLEEFRETIEKILPEEEK